MKLPGLVLLCAAASLAQSPYDLLLKGGHVIDPKNRIDGPMDVAEDGFLYFLPAEAGEIELKKVLR